MDYLTSLSVDYRDYGALYKPWFNQDDSVQMLLKLSTDREASTPYPTSLIALLIQFADPT